MCAPPPDGFDEIGWGLRRGPRVGQYAASVGAAEARSARAVASSGTGSSPATRCCHRWSATTLAAASSMRSRGMVPSATARVTVACVPRVSAGISSRSAPAWSARTPGRSRVATAPIPMESVMATPSKAMSSRRKS